MDGSEVAEPHFPVKLVQHGRHPALRRQVVPCNRVEACEDCCFATATPGTRSPAAKAWQVSRHTPTRLWSLTLSMMLLSSENLPPTVLPWPLMFSNTGFYGGRRIKTRPKSDIAVPGGGGGGCSRNREFQWHRRHLR